MIPPDRSLELRAGHLCLSKGERLPKIPLPIDLFFRSLAEDRQEQAICIVMSGSGSDGSQGLRDVKSEGGLVLAQSPETAEHDGMTLHNFIYELADNPLIGPILQAQWTYTQRVMGEALLRDETPRIIWDQHQRMIDAVVAADGDEAERLAREHILESADFMIGQLRNGHDGAANGALPSLGPNGVFSLPLARVPHSATSVRRIKL